MDNFSFLSLITRTCNLVKCLRGSNVKTAVIELLALLCAFEQFVVLEATIDIIMHKKNCRLNSEK